MSRSYCQNCDWVGADEQLQPIEDYHDRVSPGELAPSGECPQCGALCLPSTNAVIPSAIVYVVDREGEFDVWADEDDAKRVCEALGLSYQEQSILPSSADDPGSASFIRALTQPL